MYDVKKDQSSVYNNIFTPLKVDATVGSETALYTALKAAEAEQLRCAIM